MYAINRTQIGRLVAAMSVLAVAACSDSSYGDGPSAPVEPLPQGTVLLATGAAVAGKVTEFQGLLGEPNNGATPGQQAGGRRQLTWDGVPDTQTNTNTFPGDFFNVNSPRGIITTTPGSGFRISNNDFGDLDTLYAAEFEKFSGQRTFMSVGSTVTDVTFRVAGDTVKAHVRGFGVVFSDVDLAASARLEFYDAAGRRIADVHAPARSDSAGHSFAAVIFDERVVARVRITSGQGNLGIKDLTDGGTADVVVMDDFLYDEPFKP
jgi:hypothetical protein